MKKWKKIILESVERENRRASMGFGVSKKNSVKRKRLKQCNIDSIASESHTATNPTRDERKIERVNFIHIYLLIYRLAAIARRKGLNFFSSPIVVISM